jgi:hypothetical protein
LEHHRWLGDLGKIPALSQSFLHDLSGLQRVSPRLEDEHNRGETGDGLRRDVVEPRHAVEEQLLHGRGDQLLDLDGREPEGLRLHFDVHRGEVRQCVHRGVAELHGPQGEEADDEAGYEQGKLKAGTSDVAEDDDHPGRSSRMPCENGFARARPAEASGQEDFPRLEMATYVAAWTAPCPQRLQRGRQPPWGCLRGRSRAQWIGRGKATVPDSGKHGRPSLFHSRLIVNIARFVEAS